MLTTTRKKWYSQGLRFECMQCGNCCSGAPGYVWVTKQHIARIAEFLGCDDGRLGEDCVRRIGLRLSLTEKPGGDCIFLRREGEIPWCAIYEVRPVQCRTWPFWSENIRSKRAWDSAADKCPGMNKGELYDLGTIEKLRLEGLR